MRGPKVAIVGAAETSKLGRIPELSNLGLNADAALNAMADAGLLPGDIDGLACGYEIPSDLANYLGIYPTWTDHTSVGGCSWMIMVRHAAAAIQAGLCNTVLIAHGESGRSHVGGPYYGVGGPGTLAEQFEFPFGFAGAVTMFTLPVLRYMREYGVSEEDLAYVAVVQREWAARNPRAAERELVSVRDVLESKMIAYPFRRLMCCLVSDGGGALILTSTERARDFPQPPVYVLGAGEAYETRLTGIAQVRDLLQPACVRTSARTAFDEAGIGRHEVDHLMVYDAFAHCQLYGLEGLGFCEPGEAARFIRERHTAPGGKLPMNTNGGGLSYAHSGSYGMFVMQESVRQLRGTAAAQVHDARISVCQGWGGFFSASATLVLGNQRP
jgi:acetyl-CoA acetyltransferase